MASNKGDSDSLVKERRLRPIYELLDANNNKRVVQEVDRLLKKQPTFICAKVLKALALLRLGKNSECLSIITPIFSDATADENTLQALAICYRELDQPEMVCKLLEKASADDASEDLLTQCFMAQVRVSDFQKQYQTAMKLYKMYPQTTYFTWAVMSLLVKVERDTDPAALRISLPLAERMISKFIEENKIESEQEYYYYLYILILKKQGNYDKILDIMNSAKGKNVSVTTGYFHRTVIECLKEKNDRSALMSFLEDAISQHADEWKFYKEYIEYFTEKEGERVHNFLKVLWLNAMDKSASRPVLLSQLLFIKTCSAAGVDHQLDITKILNNYFIVFGNKPFFFADVKFALRFLTNDDDITSFLDTVKGLMPDPIRFTSVDDVQMKLNHFMLTRYFRNKDIKMTTAKTMDFVQTLVKCYLDGRDAQTEIGADWNSLEALPQDDFMTIAGLTLIDSYWNDSSTWKGYFGTCQIPGETQASENTKDVKGERRLLLEKLNSDIEFCPSVRGSSSAHKKVFEKLEKEKDSKEDIINNGVKSLDLNDKSAFAPNEEKFPIFLSMAILESVLERSPNSSQARLLLAKAYMRCGAIGAGADLVIGLDLKHIQWESLGYLYIWKLASSGFDFEADRVLHMAENFYTNYQRESMEHVLSAYKYGSWEKILEFMDFRDLLVNSVQFGLIAVEKRLLQFGKSGYSHNQTLKIAGEIDLVQIAQHFVNFERYTDNRDMDVLLTYTEKAPCEDLQKITFNAEVERLKIRSLLLSLMTNFVLLPSLKSDKYKASLAEIETLLAKLKILAEGDYSAFNFATPSLDQMWSPSLYRYVSAGYLNLLLHTLSLTFELAKDAKDEEIKMLTTRIEEIVKTINHNCVKNWTAKSSSILNWAEIVEEVFMFTETLGFCCILVDACGELLKKNVPLAGKTKKKKCRESCESFNSLLTVFADIVKKVENEILAIDIFEPGFPTKWSQLSKFWFGKVNEDLQTYILPFSVVKVMQKLNHSYTKSLNEMSLNIKQRKKYIEGCYIKNLT